MTIATKFYRSVILSILSLGVSGTAAEPVNEAPQVRLITTCLRLPDGAFHLCVDKPDGFAFRLEVSEGLSTWVSLCTNVVTDGALRFVDPEALQQSRRFYRIVPQSNYAPEE